MSRSENIWTGKKIVITGGAGYVATSLVGLLKDRRCRIVRFDRPKALFPIFRGKAVIEDVTGDVRERGVWEQLLKGTDVVFHLAAQTSVYVANGNPPADWEINVGPMLMLLHTCSRKKWHPGVFFAGTVTECGIPTHLPVDETHADNPITIYDIHKLMAENYLEYYCMQQEVKGSVLRLANVYGPGPRSGSADRGVLNMMIRRALRGERLTIYGEGRPLRDYVYIGDVARAFLFAVENVENVNGRHFVIGSGKRHTIAEAIELVAARAAARTGRAVPVAHVEPERPQSPIEHRNFVADCTRFRRATGWRPTVGLKEGIDKTIEYFLEAEGG